MLWILYVCILAAGSSNSTQQSSDNSPSNPNSNNPSSSSSSSSSSAQSTPSSGSSSSSSSSSQPSNAPAKNPASSTPASSTPDTSTSSNAQPTDNGSGSSQAQPSNNSWISQNIVYVIIASVGAAVLLLGALLFCCAKSVGNGNRKEADAVLPWMHRPIQLQGNRPSLGSGSTPVQFGNSSQSPSPPLATSQMPAPQPSYGYEQQGYDPNYNYQQQPHYQPGGTYDQYPQRIDSPVLDQSFGLGVANDQIPPAHQPSM